jgi:hypothetical protein
MTDGRLVAIRWLAACSALLWLLPGYAIADLTVTWTDPWPVVLEAGWGLLFGVFVAVPFITLAVDPANVPAVVQLCAVAVVVVVAGVLAHNWQAIVTDAVLALQVIAILLIGGRRAFWRRLGPPQLSVALVLATIAGLVPWTVYAHSMFSADRENRPGGDITNGVDHYAVQGALGLVLIALTGLTATWPLRFLSTGLQVAVSAFYLGLVSLAHQDAVAGFSTFWSLMAMLWGVVVALAVLAARRGASPLSIAQQY